MCGNAVFTLCVCVKLDCGIDAFVYVKIERELWGGNGNDMGEEVKLHVSSGF